MHAISVRADFIFPYVCCDTIKVKNGGSMQLSATKLRNNIYRILDRVLETGVPIEVKRKGKIVRIVAAEPPDRLNRLKKRDCMNVDPEELVHMDWSAEWRE